MDKKNYDNGLFDLFLETFISRLNMDKKNLVQKVYIDVFENDLEDHLDYRDIDSLLPRNWRCFREFHTLSNSAIVTNNFLYYFGYFDYEDIKNYLIKKYNISEEEIEENFPEDYYYDYMDEFLNDYIESKINNENEIEIYFYGRNCEYIGIPIKVFFKYFWDIIYVDSERIKNKIINAIEEKDEDIMRVLKGIFDEIATYSDIENEDELISYFNRNNYIIYDILFNLMKYTYIVDPIEDFLLFDENNENNLIMRLEKIFKSLKFDLKNVEYIAENIYINIFEDR